MRVSQEAKVALRELGTSLRRSREARGQTVTEVATTMDIDPGDLARLEAADPGVSVGVLLAALHAHGVASRLRTLVPAPIVALTPEEEAAREAEFRF